MTVTTAAARVASFQTWRARQAARTLRSIKELVRRMSDRPRPTRSQYAALKRKRIALKTLYEQAPICLACGASAYTTPPDILWAHGPSWEGHLACRDRDR